MDKKSVEKRKELLKVVDSLPTDKLDGLKLLISGFAAGVEASQVKKTA